MKPPFPGQYSSLCAPDDEKSCFGCCPPIRPAGYDHIDHRAEMTRSIEANTHALKKGIPENGVIYGDHCWGLGYLDPDKKRIGCLLHPAAHYGRDSRDKTGYGEKCRRELCREAKIFATLGANTRALVLEVADGLDSFEYSSRMANPAFHMLKWGPAVTESIAVLVSPGRNSFAIESVFAQLNESLTPEVDGYALECFLVHLHWERILAHEFIKNYKTARADFIHRRRRIMMPPVDNRPFVHQLNIPDAFVRFLRSALEINRSRPSEAVALLNEYKAMIDALT